LIRVVLADDHEMFRKGIRRLLEDSGEVTVVGEAGSGDEALALLEATAADVLVLDISMPGPGVMEVLRRLRSARPGLRVVILSVYDEEQYAVRALRAGASAYLTKERSPEELVEAVRRVHRGHRFVSPAIERRLAAGGNAAALGDQPPHSVLSSREYDVLRLLGAGLSIKEISARMSLSPKTVSTFRARILKKMGFKGNADIVRYVVAHGLEA
jgi:DNA-binding NarL/FixJ family response regulator